MRVRRNVWTLPSGDETLLWYGKAVGAMQALPAADPRSWRYQAAIHGSPEPAPAELAQYWEQCQHSSSFFLPWHRMYLLRFEQIVLAQIAAMGGPADWALPYWDYSGDPAWSLLPVAFRSSQRDDGSPNPLYVEARSARANAGAPFLGARDVDVTSAMRAAGTTSTGGFFGPPPANHVGGTEPFGALELQPHNAVHVAVGSDAIVGGRPADGWMLDPDFAALDPIFWLHHANIDRLWEVWLRRDAAHQNLASPYWLDGVSFEFHDASGAPVTMTTRDVLDTTAPALDYGYEDTRDPLVGAAPPFTRVMAPVEQHELVGATTRSVDLGEDVAHVDVPTPVTPAAFTARRKPGAQVEHVMLRLENVTSAHPAPVYDVYLNVPPGDAPSQHEDHFVGRAAMFGVAKASRPGGQHGGGGVSFAFDITDLYRRLSAANAIDLKHLRVSFVPVRARNAAKVKVGRISVYFA